MALSTIQNNSFADTAVHGRRNLIINGAGQIDQRSLGTVTGVTNTLQRHIDRWYTQLGSGATISTGASTDVPSGQGFTNSINATVTSAGSMSASYIFIQQIIEGYNIKALQAATGIKTFTVSFWVKSSVTGTYTVSIQSSNYDYSYNGTYTVDAANTWENKTVTVPATTNGTWNYTNTAGLNLRMCLGSSGGGTANTWVSGSHNGATTAVDWANNASATFYITGVQLELGSQATPFEHRSYGEELSLCQRYFQVHDQIQMAAYVDAAFRRAESYVAFPVEMRATPSVTTLSAGNSSNIRSPATTYSGLQIGLSKNGGNVHMESNGSGYMYINQRKQSLDAEL